jgi:soluble lytic murein transglycosylase-like protein
MALSIMRISGQENRRIVVLTAGLFCAALSAGARADALPARKAPSDLQLVCRAPSTEALLAFKEMPKIAAPPAAPIPAHKPFYDDGKKLSVADAILYKKIFDAQAQADWKGADTLLAQVQNNRLRGHVLMQRYTHPNYRATFAELSAWLGLYADHPGADRIYKMAELRRPKIFKGALAEPAETPQMKGFLDILDDRSDSYRSPAKRAPEQSNGIEALRAAIRADVAKGSPEEGYKRLLSDKRAVYMDNVEYDQARAAIAGGFMFEGKLDQAYDLAQASAHRSGAYAPQAGWVAGLCAWRQGKFREAAPYFALAATSPYSSAWGASGGAYWASRAHMRAGDVDQVTPWLKTAAKNPRTFYGLIATRALGWDSDFNWDMPQMTAERETLLQNLPAARRAYALVDSGQYHTAELELEQIDAQDDPKLLEALLSYANSVGLASYALKVAEIVPHPKGGLYDSALYPLSPWTPQGGFQVDKALINAIIRQESRFNPYAESRNGAIGLMQLMPATASFVDNQDYSGRDGKHSLKDPQGNLEIGQHYVASLLAQESVGNDMLSLAIAYNAGPGNLKKWKDTLSGVQNDPLLFLESIPVAETRAFAERVMANYWIYRVRMKQGAPSLDAVAGGHWASYAADSGKPSKAVAALY